MPDASSPSNSREIIDNHSMIRLTFLIVPLYALAVVFYALQMTSIEMPSVAQNVAKNIVRVPVVAKMVSVACLLFFVGLAGIAWRSLECAKIMKRDPFRAFAMGRFILIFYVIASVPLHLISTWPRSTLTVPLDALVEHSEDVAVIKITEVSVLQVNPWTWLLYLVDVGQELFALLSLCIFAWATYELLAANRPPYTLDHFVHDITFGWKGVKYVG